MPWPTQAALQTISSTQTASCAHPTLPGQSTARMPSKLEQASTCPNSDGQHPSQAGSMQVEKEQVSNKSIMII